MERRDRYYELNPCEGASGKLTGAGKAVRGLHSRTSTEDVINDTDWYRH